MLERAERPRLYALEISEEMIQLLNRRKEAAVLDNLDIRKVEESLPLDDDLYPKIRGRE